MQVVESVFLYNSITSTLSSFSTSPTASWLPPVFHISSPIVSTSSSNATQSLASSDNAMTSHLGSCSLSAANSNSNIQPPSSFQENSLDPTTNNHSSYPPNTSLITISPQILTSLSSPNFIEIPTTISEPNNPHSTLSKPNSSSNPLVRMHRMTTRSQNNIHKPIFFFFHFRPSTSTLQSSIANFL